MPVGYAQVVLADSPASYWRLGDLTAGASAADSAGTVTGTYENGSLLGMAGALQGDPDTAAWFDGANDDVNLGNVYNFVGTAAFSAEAWVQPESYANSTWNVVFGKVGNDANGFQGWQIVVHNDGSAQFFRSVNGVEKIAQSAVGSVPLDTWSHLVGTYDGSTSRLYINGSLAASVADTASLVSTTFNAYIGYDGLGNHFNGSIDEVAVYNSTLSAARVLAHYNAARFSTNAPTYLAALASNTQTASAGQVNQMLGSHTLSIHTTGFLLLGQRGSSTPGNTWSLGTQWVDQPFTLPANQDRVDRVEVALERLGSGADVTVTLQADSAGKPSGTALSTVVVPVEFVPPNRGRMVSLPLHATGLSPGSVYHIVLQMSGSSGNTLEAFDGGTGFGVLQTSTNGTTWTAHTGTQLFAGVYVNYPVSNFGSNVDGSAVRNVCESSTAWAELEYDGAGRLAGTYEMVQGSRTAHYIQYSSQNRLMRIV